MVHAFPYAEAKNQATTQYNILMVNLSESCIKSLNAKINIGCPTLQELIPLDSSNKFISGKFVKINDTWIRQKPQTINHYMFYGNDKLSVCVECVYPSGNPDLVKSIMIEPTSFVWPERDQVVSNGKVIIFHDRYVSENCNSATISYNYNLLVDTINYISNSCTYTNYNGTGTILIKNTPFDLRNPYSSLKHYAWLPMAKKTTIGNCIFKKCETPRNPYSKW